MSAMYLVYGYTLVTYHLGNWSPKECHEELKSRGKFVLVSHSRLPEVTPPAAPQPRIYRGLTK